MYVSVYFLHEFLCVCEYVFFFSSVLYLELISQQQAARPGLLLSVKLRARLCVSTCVCVLLSTASPVVVSMLSECPLIAGLLKGLYTSTNLVLVSQEGKVVLNVFIVPLKVDG